MSKKSEININLPATANSASLIATALLERLLGISEVSNGISITKSFNKNKIYIVSSPIENTFSVLRELGINEETVKRIADNSADIVRLKQQVEDLQQELAAVRANRVVQKLKMDELSAELEELSRQYSSLTEQQRAENTAYREKLADIQEKYSAEILRVRESFVEWQDQTEQAIADIQEILARSATNAESAAQIENESLIREIIDLKRKIKKLEEKKGKTIINYDIIESSGKNSIVSNTIDRQMRNKDLELLNLKWHKKIPPLEEAIKHILSQVPLSERELYKKSENELKELGCSIFVNNDIVDSQFAGQEKLLSVVISKGVTSIGENAFFGCKRLIRVYIPDSVKTIGKNAFAYCSKYLKIYFEAKRDDDWYEYKDDWNPHEYKIMFGFGSKKAKWMKKLVSFDEDVDITAFLEDESIFPQYYDIDKDSFTLKHYKGNHKKIIIPKGIKTIGYYALSGCDNLEDVILPNEVEFIAEDAFYSCINLKSITFGNRIKHICYDAFAKCYSLTQIIYSGTIAEWKAIKKDRCWDSNTGKYVVKCNNGTLTK